MNLDEPSERAKITTRFQTSECSLFVLFFLCISRRGGEKSLNKKAFPGHQDDMTFLVGHPDSTRTVFATIKYWRPGVSDNIFPFWSWEYFASFPNLPDPALEARPIGDPSKQELQIYKSKTIPHCGWHLLLEET